MNKNSLLIFKRHRYIKIHRINALFTFALVFALASCSFAADNQKSALSSSDVISEKSAVSSFAGKEESSGLNSSKKNISSSLNSSKSTPSKADSSALLRDVIDPALTAKEITDFLASPLLKVVNKQNTLPKNYIPELSDVTKYSSSGSKRSIASVCYDALCSLMEASKSAGVKVNIVSAYRSYSTQKSIYDTNVQKRINSGYSKDKAVALTQRTIMPPGSSEHQYGYAADISEKGALQSSLEKTAGFHWLAKNAPDYGFILRYPKNKESITGVAYEPWHFRYVGTYHSKIITSSGLCLEEYINALELRLKELSGA